jgi:(1->4)-alpha-D-glucan 1-alpha-D-glucosylmutase
MTTMDPAPRATYRLQLGPGFGFAEALRLTPYLKRLGVSHLYLSPIFEARRGSTHGYDISDHRKISEELGGEATFVAWAEEARAAGLAIVLDFVPNHMGVGRSDNPWWLDVLAWGRRSRYAEMFDIDWEPAKAALSGKVLVPLLGDHYGAVLERGELELHFDHDRGSFAVHYFEHRFPLTPSSYARIFRESSRSAALGALLAELRGLDNPGAEAVLGGRLFEHVAGLEKQLADLAKTDEVAAAEIEQAVARFRDTDGRRELHELLELQSYRLAYFRVAADEINYRRFFNINELAGLRVEIGEVWDVVHEKIMGLVDAGLVQGIRIDHVDGLFDPGGYCRRLRQRASDGGREIYLVVEKILAEHERLRDDWGVDGTTGYDFLGETAGLFVDPKAESPLRAFYRRQVGEALDLDQDFFQAKCETIDHQLSAELQVLANMLDRIGERNNWTRDFTLSTLRQALRLTVASFPVYRTYVAADHGARDDDRRDIVWAVAQARKRAPAIDDSVFDFLERAMLGELGTSLASGYDPLEAMRFAMKVQQYTGPVMAKAIEDCAFYRHPLLLSLADVGADPRRFGLSVAAFHHRQERRRERFPQAMLALSTHDTKRGADARARIAVLSEIPGMWAERVAHWNKLNRSRRMVIDDERAPNGRDCYWLYQALVGGWPADVVGAVPTAEALGAFTERFAAYAKKALREAKLRSGWVRPNTSYEEATDRFVRLVLNVDRPNKFLDDFVPFQRRVAEVGALNALSQLVLQLTVPGVPDIYQGAELWDLSLVDPDNRRPVDFEARARLLEEVAEVRGDGVDELVEQWPDGRIKLLVSSRLLRLRAEHPALFARGDYRPLAVEGRYDDHVVAFMRRDDSTTMVVAVGRLLAGLAAPGEWPLRDAWRNTSVAVDGAGDEWVEALTGERLEALTKERLPAGDRVPLADLFRHLPVAVLIRHDAGGHGPPVGRTDGGSGGARSA